MSRYRDGAVSYLDVVTAQTTELDTQIAALDVDARRLQASVGVRARRRLARRAFMNVSSSARPVPARAHPITSILPASPSQHRPLSLEKDHAMKTLMFATLLSRVRAAGRASATQPDTATAPQTYAATASASLSSQPAWNARPATPLTRAQVYRQLVRAERDGQLAQLNRELYSH